MEARPLGPTDMAVCLEEHSPGPQSGLQQLPQGPVHPSSALSSASLQESVDLGEIMFSLCYLPTAGRLTLTVIKCRNLKAMDITGYSGTSPTQVVCHVAFQPPRH